MAVRVVTDSTSDLPKDQAQELGICVVPLTVQFGDDVYRDGVDLESAEFFAKLTTSRVTPTTAAPPAGLFEETYRQLIRDGADGILAVQLSSVLSGTYNSAVVGAEALKDQPVPIEVVDSRSVSGGLGLPVMAAARAAREGKSLAECKAIAEDMLARMHIYAVLDTLEFLQRGGRIGKARQLVGTLLNVKPMLTVKGGAVLPLENVRTRSKAHERIAQLLEKLGPIEIVGIAESDEEIGQQLTRAIRTVYAGPIEHFRLGPVVGTHTGPGTSAVCAVART
ncbi:MAG TPA: DegV family protein [Ktedonobacterales bacterium]|nr:DegV family protein [Ktedonobacterales bacterium]